MKEKLYFVGERPSHYDILGVREDAPYSEIRHRYRGAALQLHPDKFASHKIEPLGQHASSRVCISKTSVLQTPGKGTSYEENDFCHGSDELDVMKVCSAFSDVQEAWQVLRDAESRAKYDNFLLAYRASLENSVLIGDTVHIEEMDFFQPECEEQGEFSSLCRCGDHFVIERNVLEKLGFLGIEGSETITLEHGLKSQKVESFEKDARQQQAFETTDKIPHLLEQERMHDGYAAESKGWMETMAQTCFERKSVLVPCSSCSLHLKVQFEVQAHGESNR